MAFWFPVLCLSEMHKVSVDSLGELPVLLKEMVAAAAASWSDLSGYNCLSIALLQNCLPGTAQAYPDMLFKNLFYMFAH